MPALSSSPIYLSFRFCLSFDLELVGFAIAISIWYELRIGIVKKKTEKQMDRFPNASFSITKTQRQRGRTKKKQRAKRRRWLKQPTLRTFCTCKKAPYNWKNVPLFHFPPFLFFSSSKLLRWRTLSVRCLLWYFPWWKCVKKAKRKQV